MDSAPETRSAHFGVVIPAYTTCAASKEFDFKLTPHVVVVNDGSDDGSTAVADEYPVTLLRHEHRTGVGAAIRTGLLHLKRNG